MSIKFMSEESPLLTLVSPCFNEEDALPTLIEKVVPVIDELTNGCWSIVIVDDGSTDRTWEVLRELNAKDPRVTGVSLSRNFGHQPAITAGLAFSHAKYTAIMDADLQDPVETLAELYEKVDCEEYDVALGIRGKRDSPLWLRFCYSSFYRIIRQFSDHEWPLDAGDFSVFNRSVLKTLLSLPERDRMLRGLRSWVGFRQALVTYDRPARTQGETKYNIFRLMGLAMNAFVGFTSLPLRIASFLGLFMSFMSFSFAILFIINRLIPQFRIYGYNVGENPGTATLAVLISFTSGMLFFCMGIIGEYVALVVREIKRRPTAIIADRIGTKGAHPTEGGVLVAEKLEPIPASS